MLGGSYTRNANGSLTLVQRTLEPDEAKAAAAALDAETGATPASDTPLETKPAGKSGRKDT